MPWQSHGRCSVVHSSQDGASWRHGDARMREPSPRKTKEGSMPELFSDREAYPECPASWQSIWVFKCRETTDSSEGCIVIQLRAFGVGF